MAMGSFGPQGELFPGAAGTADADAAAAAARMRAANAARVANTASTAVTAAPAAEEAAATGLRGTIGRTLASAANAGGAARGVIGAGLRLGTGPIGLYATGAGALMSAMEPMAQKNDAIAKANPDRPLPPTYDPNTGLPVNATNEEAQAQQGARDEYDRTRFVQPGADPAAAAPAGLRDGQRPLPKGMFPSTEVAGRGHINPAMPTTPPMVDGPNGPGTTQPYRVDRPGQSPLFSNVQSNQDFNDHKGTVSIGPGTGLSVGGQGGSGPSSADRVAADLRTADWMREKNLTEMGMRDRGDANYYLTGAGAHGGAGATNMSARTINDRRPSLSGGMSEGFERNMAQHRADQAQQAQIAAAHDATTLRAAQGHDNVAMYGHGVADAGHRLNAEVAFMNNQRQIAQAERQFQFEKQKDDRAATESSQAADQKMIENTFQTRDDKGNSVPDRARIADYNKAVTATLPKLIEELAQGSPEERAHAKKLQSQGPAALGPDGHQLLMQLFDRRDRMSQAHGMMPGEGTYKHSDNLLDFRQAPGAAGVQRNLLTPNQVRTVNGSTVSPNDLRYQDGLANSILPDFGKKTTSRYNEGLRTR